MAGRLSVALPGRPLARHRLKGVTVTRQRSVEEILASSGALFAYIFGSRATGEPRAQSDADVAIMSDCGLDLLERARLAADLAEALHSPDVDLVVLDEARLELRGHVVQEGRVIYSRDEPRRVDFEVRTRSEYFDYLPTLRELERAYLARIADRGL
jgi:predicted nucleotidyltransferase